jgi:hypothetical protein
MQSVATSRVTNASARRVDVEPLHAVDVRAEVDVAEAFHVVQFIAGPLEVASHIPLAGVGAATSVPI